MQSFREASSSLRRLEDVCPSFVNFSVALQCLIAAAVVAAIDFGVAASNVAVAIATLPRQPASCCLHLRICILNLRNLNALGILPHSYCWLLALMALMLHLLRIFDCCCCCCHCSLLFTIHFIWFSTVFANSPHFDRYVLAFMYVCV